MIFSPFLLLYEKLLRGGGYSSAEKETFLTNVLSLNKLFSPSVQKWARRNAVYMIWKDAEFVSKQERIYSRMESFMCAKQCWIAMINVEIPQTLKVANKGNESRCQKS